MYSSDGERWKLIASGKRGLPKPPLALARWADGLLVVGEEDRRLSVWVTETLGYTSPIEPERKPELPFGLVEGGDRLRPGVTYAYPVWIHCGIDQLGVFNGRAWILEQEPAEAPPPETWPSKPDWLNGTLRLTESNRIEYSVPGGVIAIYRPVDRSRLGVCD